MPGMFNFNKKKNNKKKKEKVSNEFIFLNSVLYKTSNI